MSKGYKVKELFATLQGEGTHAGTPAIFLRLAGCNMWSGFDEDRARDAQRNGAECPRWCDTDFTGGDRMTAVGIAHMIREHQNQVERPLLVITGGEPLLQVDDELLSAIKRTNPEMQIAIETNGTVYPRFDLGWVLDDDVWITMSPKTPRATILLTPDMVAELKLVFPAYSPSEWSDWTGIKYLQPVAAQKIRTTEIERVAADYVIHHPGWKLSLQTHKILDIE